MTQHTPGQQVGPTGTYEGQKLIIAALLEALEQARFRLASYAEVFAAMADPEHCLHTDAKHGYDWKKTRDEARKDAKSARAAIAAAKGES